MDELQRHDISFSRDISPQIASVQHSPLNQIPRSHSVCLAVLRVLGSQLITLHTCLQLCWDWSWAPIRHISRADKETLNPSMTRVWYWDDQISGMGGRQEQRGPYFVSHHHYQQRVAPVSGHHSQSYRLCSAHAFLEEKPNSPGVHHLQDGLNCVLAVPLACAQLCRAKPCTVQGRRWSEAQVDPHCGFQDNNIVTKLQAWLSNSAGGLGVSIIPSKGCLFAGL